MEKFKVIIVEDVPLELKGTLGIIRNDIPEAEVIGTATNEAEYWKVLKQGLPDLLQKVAEALPPTRRRVRFLFPFALGSAAAQVRAGGVVHAEEYTADGLLLDVTAELSMLEKYKDYLI